MQTIYDICYELIAVFNHFGKVKEEIACQSSSRVVVSLIRMETNTCIDITKYTDIEHIFDHSSVLAFTTSRLNFGQILLNLS